MTHDPLCPRSHPITFTASQSACECIPIHRVRQHEKRQQTLKWLQICANLERDAMSDGYAAALRDAVQAVAALPHTEPCQASCCMGDYDCSCGRRAAVAAIEALAPSKSRISHTCPDNNCCMGDPE